MVKIACSYTFSYLDITDKSHVSHGSISSLIRSRVTVLDCCDWDVHGAAWKTSATVRCRVKRWWRTTVSSSGRLRSSCAVRAKLTSRTSLLTTRNVDLSSDPGRTMVSRFATPMFVIFSLLYFSIIWCFFICFLIDKRRPIRHKARKVSCFKI